MRKSRWIMMMEVGVLCALLLLVAAIVALREELTSPLEGSDRAPLESLGED